MASKRKVRVDRQHQLWGWPGKWVGAYRKPDTPDQPFRGVREAWIICRLPFMRDWRLESIDTNLRIYDFVLTSGEQRIVVQDAWIDWWVEASNRGKTREQLDEACAAFGYDPVLPDSFDQSV